MNRIKILPHPGANIDGASNSVAMLISVIGLMLGLLGLNGLLQANWLGYGVGWAFLGLGSCTFGLGLVLRYSCKE